MPVFQGLRPRHSVAILSSNCHQWLLAKMGAIFANGMACGIYQTSSPDSIKCILEDSGADILVVEDSSFMNKVLKITNGLKAIVQISGEIIEPLTNVPTLTWSALMDLGASQSEDKLNYRLATTAINQCCLLERKHGLRRSSILNDHIKT